MLLFQKRPHELLLYDKLTQNSPVISSKESAAASVQTGVFSHLTQVELVSCSGGSSVVHGPSEGRMRTGGGRSNPAPGFLGNAETGVYFI